MATCRECGGHIEFRVMNGVRTPIHLSGGCSGGSDRGGGYVSPLVTRTLVSPLEGDNLCRPTKCPVCRGAVFFIRYNGGSVWVDELGWPWPKHPCMDEQGSAFTNLRQVAQGSVDANKVGRVGRVGVVGEAGTVRYTLLAIDCLDGHRACVSLHGQHGDLNGQLVSLKLKDGESRLFFGASIAWPILSLRIDPEMLELPRVWATFPAPPSPKAPSPPKLPEAKPSKPTTLPSNAPRPKPEKPKRITVCPECQCSIRESRLPGHLKRVHKKVVPKGAAAALQLANAKPQLKVVGSRKKVARRRAFRRRPEDGRWIRL